MEQIVVSILVTRESTRQETGEEGRSMDDNNKTSGVANINCSMMVPSVVTSSMVIGNKCSHRTGAGMVDASNMFLCRGRAGQAVAAILSMVSFILVLEEVKSNCVMMLVG